VAGKKYRFVGGHADMLGDGRPVAPGDFVQLTDEDLKDPHNEALAADGLLLAVSDAGEAEVEKAARRVERDEAKTKGGEA